MHYKLYHYTSIETLALILNQKKIRFNRLDQVDDVLESSEYKKVNFSNYLFVSCWTENPEENIALWNMYTKKMKGVRIGLSKFPFMKKLIAKDLNNPLLSIVDDMIQPLTIEECINPEYFIVPVFDGFYKKVEYLDTDELNSRFENMVEKQVYPDNTFSINARSQDFAKIKHKRWSFQEESRFVLFILPPINDFDDIPILMTQLYQEKNLGITYYDMDLDPLTLQNIEVLLGPNCSDADKLIVESLLYKYDVKNEAKESSLKGKIRFK